MELWFVNYHELPSEFILPQFNYKTHPKTYTSSICVVGKKT